MKNDNLIISLQEKKDIKKDEPPNQLYDMSFEGMKHLFPVVISRHSSLWGKWFDEEKKTIVEIVGSSNIKQIDHYGSTSIPKISAKPIIDILLQVVEVADIEVIIKKLLAAGYIYDIYGSKSSLSYLPLLLMKGYTRYGFDAKVFHLHIKYDDTDDDLLFRNYLMKNPKSARKYERLKWKLYISYKNNILEYTIRKMDFVNEIKTAARYNQKANT